jgi:hypothetical protein
LSCLVLSFNLQFQRAAVAALLGSIAQFQRVHGCINAGAVHQSGVAVAAGKSMIARAELAAALAAVDDGEF